MLWYISGYIIHESICKNKGKRGIKESGIAAAPILVALAT